MGAVVSAAANEPYLDFMQRVVDFCREREMVVVNDFAYADISYDGYQPPSILSVERAKDVAVELYTLSKSHSMAGWRVGFVVGNSEIVGALRQLKSYLDYGTFQPIQIASIIALSQDSLKGRLAFSTVSQLSYIILGTALLTPLGLMGSMLHIAMHAFGKITLFFCAGAIYVATGKKYISEMVGIGRRMPVTMIAFLVGSLGVVGLPLAGGFEGDWYVKTAVRWQKWCGERDVLLEFGEWAPSPVVVPEVAEELVPEMESLYSVRKSDAWRGLLGSSFGAIASLSAAWRNPGVFGRMCLLSGSFLFTDIEASTRLWQERPDEMQVTSPKGDVYPLYHHGGRHHENDEQHQHDVHKWGHVDVGH